MPLDFDSKQKLLVVLYRYTLEKVRILITYIYKSISISTVLILPWLVALILIGYIVLRGVMELQKNNVNTISYFSLLNIHIMHITMPISLRFYLSTLIFLWQMFISDNQNTNSKRHDLAKHISNPKAIQRKFGY